MGSKSSDKNLKFFVNKLMNPAGSLIEKVDLSSWKLLYASDSGSGCQMKWSAPPTLGDLAKI